MPDKDNTRNNKTRQGKARQDKTRDDKTRQDKIKQDKIRQDMKSRDKTRTHLVLCAGRLFSCCVCCQDKPKPR